MKKNILIFSGTRADYGILKPLLKDNFFKKKHKVNFLIGSNHTNKKYGFSFNQIKKDKINVDHILISNQRDTSIESIFRFASKSLIEYFKYLKKIKPDLLIVLGDRYEVFLIVISAYLMGIKICHLHGGEITNGSFDEGFRHSISKLSNLHFVVNKKYKNRLINLGENPKFIHNFGSLSVAAIKEKKNYLTKIELLKKYNIPQNKKIILVTIHSETANNKKFLDKVDEFYNAIFLLNEYFYIFTANNRDPLGDQLFSKLNSKKIKKLNNVKLFKSMGNDLYYNFLKNVDLVIGNSSSGIIEAPTLRTPTLNIGNRQNGRLYAPSVFNCNFNKDEIVKNIKRILKNKKINFNHQLFYKKNTKKNMIKKINDFINLKKYEKKFYEK